MHLDFFQNLPQTNRESRVPKRSSLSQSEVAELKQYGKEYFDGELGYGGYYYDGRWEPVAKEMIEHYGLNEDSRVLEIGCAKGYLMYEMYKLGIKNVHGCDISSYAISCVPEEIRENFHTMSADTIAFPDKSFDFVLSIDCINNLDTTGVKNAVSEMARLSRAHSYIRIGSYRTNEEYEAITRWGVTSLTFYTPQGWLDLFKEVHYVGDYYFRFMN